ncbi:hypothetical protein SIM91_04850 [Rhodococcus opacus]|uniref:hypothetical protein n=1 Tax=Rhodococcus opacus TaxID=37919 RepID=UPI000689B243|nr:hypothetical protein [Rhodococcus opacus]MDX5962651.1 hypothetical protein [Rhodococcus opacus]CAG7636086.1 hypothetical protein E143388_07755 [Rhodococcus opacus]
MTRHTITAVVLLTLIVAGCSRSPNPAAPLSTEPSISRVMPATLPTLDPATIDNSDPDAVAIAFAETSYTLLPGADPDMNAGMVRAAAVLEPKLANDIRAQVGRSSPGYEWRQWAQVGAMVDATAAIDTQEVPPQTDGEAYRMVRVTQTVENSTRFVARQHLVLLLTLVNVDGGWMVSRLTQL